MVADRAKAPILIAVPVYEGCDFLAESLGSIRDQTFTDFRALIAVDGDDRRSFEVAKAFAGDARFEVVLHRDAKGSAGNLSWLMRQLREDFFCYVQQDDICDPDYVRALHDHAVQHPEAASAYCDMRFFGGRKGRVAYPSILGPPLDRVLDQIEQNFAIPRRGLIRRKALRAAGPVASGPKQDTIWTARLARQGELHRVPRELYLKRVHERSVSFAWRNLPADAWRAVALNWAVGVAEAALPVTPRRDHTGLLAFIVDRMTRPRDGRPFYFDIAAGGSEAAVDLTTDFLSRARSRLGLAPRLGEPDGQHPRFSTDHVRAARALIGQAADRNPAILARNRGRSLWTACFESHRR